MKLIIAALVGLALLAAAAQGGLTGSSAGPSAEPGQDLAETAGRAAGQAAGTAVGEATSSALGAIGTDDIVKASAGVAIAAGGYTALKALGQGAAQGVRDRVGGHRPKGSVSNRPTIDEPTQPTAPPATAPPNTKPAPPASTPPTLLPGPGPVLTTPPTTKPTGGLILPPGVERPKPGGIIPTPPPRPDDAMSTGLCPDAQLGAILTCATVD